MPLIVVDAFRFVRRWLSAQYGATVECLKFQADTKQASQPDHLQFLGVPVPHSPPYLRYSTMYNTNHSHCTGQDSLKVVTCSYHLENRLFVIMTYLLSLRSMA